MLSQIIYVELNSASDFDTSGSFSMITNNEQTCFTFVFHSPHAKILWLWETARASWGSPFWLVGAGWCTCWKLRVDVLGTTCAASGPLGLASGKLPSAHAHRDAGELNAVLLHIPWLDESVFFSWTGTLWYQQQRAQEAERQGTGTSQVFFQSQNVTPHAIGWLGVVFICMRLAGISVSRSWAVRETGRDLCRQVCFFCFFFLVFDVYLAI